MKDSIMGMPVLTGDQLNEQAKAYALAECRSIAGQIELWAMVDKTVLDNPDIIIDLVKDLLVARSERASLATPFIPQGSD